MIDGDPLPGANSAAVIRAALDRDQDVAELEERELRAVYGVINTLDTPLPDDLPGRRDAIAGALDISDS